MMTNNRSYAEYNGVSCLQWVDARQMFQEASELVDAEKGMKKTMWGQFWSSHQRFFKYLCIGAKVGSGGATQWRSCVVVAVVLHSRTAVLW